MVCKFFFLFWCLNLIIDGEIQFRPTLQIFLWLFFLRISSSHLVNNRVKLGRVYLTNIRIQMDQVIVQTDLQLVKEYSIFQTIWKFITVISIALFLHQSCARWIHSTLFSLISVQRRFKLLSHLRQYIRHGLFIQVYAQNPLSTTSLSYMCQLHSLITLFLHLSPKSICRRLKVKPFIMLFLSPNSLLTLGAM